MQIRLKNIIAVITLVIIASLSTITNAENIVQMKLSSSSQLVAGATVEVTLSLTNVNAGEGIDTLAGKMNYDTEVFEQLTEDDFYGQNRWNFQTYNPDTNLFILSKTSKVTSSMEVLKITLKVKQSLTKEATEVAISEIGVSGGTETGDIEVESVSVMINAPQTTPPPETGKNEIVDPGTDSGSQNEIVDPETNNGSKNEIVDPGTNSGSKNEIVDPGTNSGSKNEIVDPGTNNGKKNEVANPGTNNDYEKNKTNQQQNNGPVIDNSGTSGKIPQTGAIEDIIFYSVIVASIIGIIAYIKYRMISKDIK